MSNDMRSTDADLGVVTSALENGLSSCRSVVKNYRAILEQGLDASRADGLSGGAFGVENTDQTNAIACSDPGSNSGFNS